MLFKRIMVPYDGSKFSIHAFKIALDMAKKYGSKITAVTCLETDIRTPFYVDARAEESILKKEKEEITKQLTKLVSTAEKSNISVNSKIIPTNNVIKSLVSFAKSNKIELVVMGSHGRKGLDKILLGSVANGIAQKVNCPVLIVR